MSSNTYACTLALIGTLLVALFVAAAHFVWGMPVQQGCLLALGIWALLTVFTMAGSWVVSYLTGEDVFDQGKNRLNSDDYASAVTSFTKYLGRKPESSQAYYYRGVAHYYAGDSNSAVADLDEAVRLCSRDPRSSSPWVSPDPRPPGICACHFARGLAHFVLGHIDQAAQDFERAYDLASPDDDKALLGLVAARHAQGRVEEAMSLSQTVLARDKRSPQRDLVKAYLCGKHPRADPLVEEVRKLVTGL